MDALINSIMELVADTPPVKVTQLAGMIRQIPTGAVPRVLDGWAQNSAAQSRLGKLLSAWRPNTIPSIELAGMLVGASRAYHHAKSEQEVELVWTGPSSKLIATRKTEQAILQVIEAAENRLFMTSFVAYDIGSIMKALENAVKRKVEVSMLLEASDLHGGSVSIDAISKMKNAIPSSRIYSWVDKDAGFDGGKVHAKVAVADEHFCFISSANLTGHAMEKNMEAGVLIRGGATPRSLHRHLEALVTTHVIKQV